MFVAIQEALRYFRPDGRIINIGSISSDFAPYTGNSLYVMTKSAVAGLTRGLARELAERRITINNVQPGRVDTDLLRAALGDAFDRARGESPLGRFGDAAEVAHALRPGRTLRPGRDLFGWHKGERCDRVHRLGHHFTSAAFERRIEQHAQRTVGLHRQEGNHADFLKRRRLGHVDQLVLQVFAGIGDDQLIVLIDCEQLVFAHVFRNIAVAEIPQELRRTPDHGTTRDQLPRHQRVEDAECLGGLLRADKNLIILHIVSPIIAGLSRPERHEMPVQNRRVSLASQRRLQQPSGWT
ncbi:SDR family NAD(P)-dependent oxidoreductase [Sphingosinithalassobacter sp. CS137]|uniref:SDR family NAD(P)-dependent oxidoreductase n=1 Tax=Sphingosinithalassobacter sp. CS137 TaxID=2762748 RepID=UPI0021CFC691|nr:SDR family oxidoreductase [Sphingosinithalassobacter sp. CS137]